jgi:uncharacterized membrane protein
MIRWLLWLLAGAFLGGVVHLMTILILPWLASQDAYARLSELGPVNTFAPLPAPTAQSAIMPFMDPSFAAVVCRYDLSNGPVKLTAPISAAYTSVSFYTRRGVAYYAINDRAAGRRTIELELMTTAQRAELQEDEEVTAADRLIVESPSETGLILVRALAPEPSLMSVAQGALATTKCEQLPPQQQQPQRPRQ